MIFSPNYSWKLLRALSGPAVLPWASSLEISPHILCPGGQEWQSSSGTSLQSLFELWSCCAGLQFFLLDGPWTCAVALSPASGFNSCTSWLFLLDGPWASPITSRSLDCPGSSYQHTALSAIFRCCWSVPHLKCSHLILSHRVNILLLMLPKKAT